MIWPRSLYRSAVNIRDAFVSGVLIGSRAIPLDVIAVHSSVRSAMLCAVRLLTSRRYRSQLNHLARQESGPPSPKVSAQGYTEDAKLDAKLDTEE